MSDTKEITLHASSKRDLRRAIKQLHKQHWTGIEDIPLTPRTSIGLGHHVTGDARRDYTHHAYVTVSLKPSGAVVRSERLVLNEEAFQSMHSDQKRPSGDPGILWNSGRGGTILAPVTLV